MTTRTERADRPVPFRLLFVCTGNICRSPYAQLRTRGMLDARLGPGWAAWFPVASAGTSAVVGSGMHPLSRERLGARADDADVAAFRGRRLPARDVALADLVLTVSRRHRSAVLELEPRALRTTFTLREFARLVGRVDLGTLPADPLARARALVPAAADRRGVASPVPADQDAVPDPIEGGPAEHAEAARIIDDAVATIVAAIAGGLGPAVPARSARLEPPRPDTERARPGPPPRPTTAPV